MSVQNDVHSIAELVGDAFSDLSQLVQNEMRLARAELSEKISQAGMGAAFLGVAAVVMIPALVLLLIAAALWLVQMGLSPVAAHIAAAVAGAVVSIVLAMIGLNRLKPEKLTPNITMQQMRRDVAAAKEMAK